MTALRAAALVAVLALAAGCQSDDTTDDPAAAPATTAPAADASTGPTGSVEPFAASSTPSASTPAVTAANTAEVCGEVDRLILAGSKKLAADSAAVTRDKETTPDELNDRLKRTIAGLAGDVRRQAARAEDPEIEKLITDVAKQLDGGAKAASPAKWLGETFVDIPPKLARDCHA
ncbi:MULTISPECIES: hypothetical protein [Micromonospora]|uniref:hypothetical protein n=1 Tax=unclassified Micromonospora TaxID=2617518 RepID=UPI001E31B3F8|nr:hypothetical protein [Micromonospora sp. NBRC 110038]